MPSVIRRTPVHAGWVRTAGLGAALLFGPATLAQTAALDPVTGEPRPGADRTLSELAPVEDAVTAASGAELTLVSRLADGETRGIALVGDILYRSNGGYLETLNVADPANPVVLGRFLAQQGVVQGVMVQGTYAYVPVSRGTPYATRGSLQIVDISNPANPQAVGQVTGRSFFDVLVSGTTAYAAGTGLRIYDVTNPAAPVARGVATVSGGSVLSVALSGTTAYVSAGTVGLAVIDVTNSAAPTVTSTLALGGFATRVVVVGTKAYLSVNDVGLVVVDVSNPAAPVELGRYLIESSQIRSVAVSGNTAYVGRDDGFVAVDVTNPAAMTLLGDIDFDASGSGQSIVLDGTTAYVGNRFSGVRVLDVANPAAISQTKLIDNGGFSFKVNVVDGIAYVADLLGQVRLVDISTPTAPVERGRVRGILNADGVDVANGIAYVVDRGTDGTSGLTRIDVSNPAAPVRLETTVTGGSAYGLDIDGSTLYVANGYGLSLGTEGSLISAGISSTPSTPPTILDDAAPGNQAFDVRVAGNTAYVATFGSGLATFNVSDPANILVLRQADATVGNFASSVEVDGTTAYLADGVFGTALALTVVDVSNPAAPVVIGSGDGISGGTAVDVAFGNKYAYASVDFVGLYQYDVANPAMPVSTTTIQSSDRATGVDAEGRYVVLADAGAGLWIFETPVRTASEGTTAAPLFEAVAFPNPFRDEASLRITLPDAADVTAEVFSVLGQRVARLAAGHLAAGTHTLNLDGRGWAAGVYVVRLTAGGQTATTRVTLQR